MDHTATYSPEDNKLRLYPAFRLDKELYERVRAAGFRYAPRQELFVAPMWTPGREDFLLELCEEIGDEDKSLVERQEERAERFTEYHENRKEDAEQARAAVARIADNIPLGQPILVGHHSERHARKDAERIENGMRRAVKMWDTAQYWKERAAGALAHAKYKELPSVRARRIKGLEADKRKQERYKADAELNLKRWQHEPLTMEWALKTANFERGGSVRLANGESYHCAWSALDQNKITPEEVRDQRLKSLPRHIAHYDRWINHYNNRIEYERAMLAESGGTEADRVKPEVGGACKSWCSFRGGFSTIKKVNKVSVTLLDNWGNGGQDFPRTIPFDKLSGLMSKAQVDKAREEGRLIGETPRGFHLADATPPEPPKQREQEPQQATFDGLRDTLKAGIKTVSAPQLFPTPADLAARMAILADIRPEHRVLEPSAGTGALIREIVTYTHDVTAVEINYTLAGMLVHQWPNHDIQVKPLDFLECNGDLGKFDRVVMNPPFQNGDDIKHIQHALTFLNPGGRLVAICANGPWQNDKLRPLAENSGGIWEELPEGTFKEQGTGVRTVLLTVEV